MADHLMTLGDVANHFHVQTWMVQKLFDSGKLHYRQKLGMYRCVYASDLPTIARELEAAGRNLRPSAHGPVMGPE